MIKRPVIFLLVIALLIGCSHNQAVRGNAAEFEWSDFETGQAVQLTGYIHRVGRVLRIERIDSEYTADRCAVLSFGLEASSSSQIILLSDHERKFPHTPITITGVLENFCLSASSSPHSICSSPCDGWRIDSLNFDN